MVVKGKRVWFASLIAACVLSFALMFVFSNAASAYAGGRWEVSSTKKLISPGVTENYVVTNDNATNSDQVIGYAVTVDLSKNTLMVGYKDYNPTKWGLQTVREQAKAMEKATGVTVVAAVNGDYFNMATGEPTGTMVMNGVQYHETSWESWFAITKDNRPMIGTGAIPENVKEAIGANVTLISNSQVTAGLDAATKQPRTAVGIDANGKVVVVVADGRQAASSGYTLSELADEMLRLGCVDAVNLDGGGSTTYAARYAGESSLKVANSPSDGVERLVSSSLMIVTQAEASGVFGEAVLTPNNDVYTPGSEVQFQAKAVDTNGFAMDMPTNVTWRLDADSEVVGTIDADGLFVAKNGIEGKVGVELVYEGQIVGATSIEICYPDSLKFGSSELSLGFGAQSDLGLHALFNQREMILKDGDLKWTVGVSDNPEFPVIGAMAGNTFVASEDATNSTATISVAVADRTEVSASVIVTVGQLPTVVWDFEDHFDETTGQTIPAEEYYNINAEGSMFQTFHYNNGNESAQIVHISSGEPVRMGSYSLRMNYDFTNVTTTEGACFGMTEEYKIPGKPTALGVWVYIPENTPNFWLRAYISNYTADGHLIKSDNVVNFTAQNQAEADKFNIPYYSDTIPAGWHYFEAPLATHNGTQLVPFSGDYYTLMALQTFRLMYVPGINLGQPTKGHVYYDNFQFVYGSNTNDLNAPVIDSVSVNGQTLSDGMTIADPVLNIQASFHEFEEKYQTGVNPDNLHVYVDGKEVDLATKSETGLNANPITLPNGTHRVEISVLDNFQNESRKSFMVTVAADTKYDTVFLTPQLGSPTLNQYYGFDVTATNMEKTSTVTFEMKLGLGLTLVAEAGEYDVFSVECALKSAINNTYEVKISRTGQAPAGTGTIAKLKVLLEKTLVQGSVFSYSLLSGSVAFDEFYQQDVTNTFILRSDQQEVEAYYEISADTMIVGNKGGYIYVTHDNLPAQGVSVYLDGVTLLGTTDAEGKLFTDRFVAEACIHNIQAEDAKGNVSFSLKVYGVLPCGDAASSAPMFIASKASADSQTSHHIGWFSNPLFADKTAQVKYALKSDYEAKGEAALTVFEGKSTVVELSASQIATENYAVLFNEARLTGLQKDAEYVYIVGNGTVWSELHDFSTKRNGTDTNFFVMGDTQLEEGGEVLLQNIASAIRQDGVSYDFGIQTGDFVDNTNSYTMWSQIMGAFSEYFGNTDMIQVLGNHEFYGDDDGSIASAFHMLPKTDWYSMMYGNTYIAVVNYSVTNNAGEMAKVFAEVAADAQKSKAVWKVLTLHQPPYYTNAAGGNEYVNQIVPQYVDEGGFDVVFSGHDHAYARTKPMKGGVVDESGAVYIVSGAVSDKGYEGIDNPNFNFDFMMNAKDIADSMGKEGYTSVYISVQTSEKTLTIKSYDVVGGVSVMIDTYTLTKNDDCTANGHTYVYKDGYLECDLCGFSIDPVAEGYTGLVKNAEGRIMMISEGKIQKNTWFKFSDDEYYFDENGLGAVGEKKVADQYGEFTFVFDNGKVIGGATAWRDNNTRYFVDGRMHIGWREIGGSIYYFASGNEATGNKVGQKLTNGRYKIKTATTPYMTNYYISFDAEGRYTHGDFHKAGNGWVYTRVRKPADPNDLWIAYCYNGWVETDHGTFYAQQNSLLVSGDHMINGVKYRFSAAGGDPRVTGNCKLLGRYYNVSFAVDGQTITQKEVFQGEAVGKIAVPDKQGNSIKTFTSAWYNGNNVYDFSSAITSNITLTAKYTTVYTQNYLDLVNVLKKLSEAEQSGTPAEKRLAVDAVTELYGKLTKAEIADAKAEGVDDTLYTQMLEKIYEVTYIDVNGQHTVVKLYEGEEIEEPAIPTKEGNSIKSYTSAWYNGDTIFDFTSKISSDITLTAKYTTVYTQKYLDLISSLERLEKTNENGTPAEKHEAVDAVTAVYETLSDTEIADAQAEDADYTLYRSMLAKLYTVTYIDVDEQETTVILYEGETIGEPAIPEKAGNSIKSFTSAWYRGEEVFDFSSANQESLTLTAKYTTVYTQNYLDLIQALESLRSVSETGSFTEILAKLNEVFAYKSTLTESEIADAAEEGADYALLNELTQRYNDIFENGKADLETAKKVSDVFLSNAAAVMAILSLAYFVLGRR